MQKLYSLLLLLVFSASCTGQIKSEQPKQNTNTQEPLPDLQTLADAGIDPNFVESSDTISTFGPNCITRDMLQDKAGNYWFATWEGIIKYDGKVFTNYTLKEGLIRFHIASCYADKKENLWFGTARGGVYRYDGKGFTLFTTKDGLTNNNVACITEDNDGNIWFGTEKGVSCYNGKTFTNFKGQGGPEGKYVNSIIQSNTKKMWIGTNDGLYIFDGENFKELKGEEGEILKVLSLLEDKTGNIWIGKFDGLTCYDGKTFTNFLSNTLTYYIIEDNAGNVLLTQSEANTHYSGWPNQVLYRYNGKAFTKVAEKYKPLDFQLFGKIVDTAGNIWFGTMHGPCRYDGKTFTYFTK